MSSPCWDIVLTWKNSGGHACPVPPSCPSTVFRWVDGSRHRCPRIHRAFWLTVRLSPVASESTVRRTVHVISAHSLGWHAALLPFVLFYKLQDGQSGTACELSRGDAGNRRTIPLSIREPIALWQSTVEPDQTSTKAVHERNSTAWASRSTSPSAPPDHEP